LPLPLVSKIGSRSLVFIITVDVRSPFGVGWIEGTSDLGHV
jgi:hypothetical protein